MHYAFMLYDKKAQLYLVEKDNRTLLNEVDFDFNCDTIYELKAEVCGDLIKCYIDGKLVIETNNDRYQYGCIAIAAYMPAQFTDVNVVCDDIAYDNYYRN